MQINQRFKISDKHPLGSYKQKLKKQFTFDEEPVKNIRRVYYDTFDWKIYDSGGMLESEITADGKIRLRWLDLSNGQILGSLPVSKVPQFIWDFPTSPFKKRLEPILDVRALLPQITIKSNIQPLKWLNKEGKMLLQVYCEENTVIAPNRKKTYPLGKCLHLMPVRGYNKPMAQVLASVKLQKAEQSPLEQALAQLGIDPGSFSSKMNVALARNLSVEQSVKLIFRHLLQTLEKNEAGVRQDVDSEFLHDFRVAIRRIRSALSQMKPLFPEKPLARFREDFAWLGQVTSSLRDLDVYLLKFNAYQAELPPELREDLEPLRALLEAKKVTEHQAVLHALDSPRYQKLLKDWEQFLKNPFFQKMASQYSQWSVPQWADERIWRVYQRVLQEGAAIQADTPEEGLHELRKTCKKFRYMMEFFQSLYPPKEIKALIKVLKQLQENLGEFQDYQVQWRSLIDFGAQIVQKRQGIPKTQMALGMLVKELQNQQAQARQIFAARFEEFASTEHQKRFETLFGKGRMSKKKG